MLLACLSVLELETMMCFALRIFFPRKLGWCEADAAELGPDDHHHVEPSEASLKCFDG